MEHHIRYSQLVHRIDTAIRLLDSGSFLYSEAAYYKSEVHLYLKDTLPELIRLAESGVHVYLMHLDVEDEIMKMIADTPLKTAILYSQGENAV